MSANIDIRAVPSLDQEMLDWLETAKFLDIEEQREQQEAARVEAEKREAQRAHMKRIAALGGHAKGANRNGERRIPKGSPKSPWASAGFAATDAGRKAWRAAGKPVAGRAKPVGNAPRAYVSDLDYAMKHSDDEGR